MIKKILLTGIIILMFTAVSFANRGAGWVNVVISGANPTWEGSTVRYTLEYQGRLDPGLNFVSSVTNGTIISQNINPYNGQQLHIRVTWNCLVTAGSIAVTETTTGQSFTYNVVLWTYGNYASFAKNCVPQLQDVIYGQTPGILSVDNCSPFCTSSYGFTYAWQVSNYDPSVLPVQYNWSTIPGAIGDTYTPDPMYVHGSKAYRRITYFYFSQGGPPVLVTIQSDPAVVRFEAQLDPGTLSCWSCEVSSYNGMPTVQATAAYGGLCYAANYVYTWEKSTDGGTTWAAFGTGEQYPATNSTITTTTLIRRKVDCSGEIKYSNTITIVFNYISQNTENRNYIRTNSILIPGVSGWPQADNLPAGDKIQSTVYFDGLGRNIQRVDKEMSLGDGQMNDRVTIVAYDAAGRNAKTYLPYNSTDAIGRFKDNALTEQQNYIQGMYPDGQQPDFPTFHSVTFEDNPLQRVIQEKMAGAAWGSSVGYNGVQTAFEYNTTDENIMVWSIDFNAGAVPYTTGLYLGGKLRKIITTDEKQKRTIEYLDEEGRVVFKKVQDKEPGNGLVENGYDGWLCTFYIYDDMERLRYIITPKAVSYLKANLWNLQTDPGIRNELCFYYEYDEKGRVIVTHSPGAGEVHTVYNKRDKAVLTQSQNQRNRPTPQWSYVLYDELDRPVASGLYDNAASRSTLQANVNSINGDNITINLFVGSTYGNVPVHVYSPVAGNSSLCFSCSNQVVNQVTVYDKYDQAAYPFTKNFNTAYSFLPSSAPHITVSSKSERTRGAVVARIERIIDNLADDGNPSNDNFLAVTSYYNEDGLPFQSLTDNIKQGVDVVTRQHDFSGKLIGVCENHTAAGTPFTNFAVLSRSDYDILGRVTGITKKIGAEPEKRISSFNYDEFGRIAQKNLSPDFNSGLGRETQDFTYNIHSWLTSMNKKYISSNSQLNQFNRFFGFYLGYDNRDAVFAAAQLNGSITGVMWKTQGDNMPRKYDYTYDNANRLTAAVFLQKEKPGASVPWSNTKMDFTVNNISYDENGNLLTMNQKGVIPGTAGGVLVDKLEYAYKQVAGGEWSNQLRKVFDNAPSLGAAQNGKLGDFKDETYNVNTDDYAYDGNGNLVLDNNKKVRVGANGNGVVWNFLNKPQKITLEGRGVIEYTYSASGERLAKKVVPQTGTGMTMYYTAGFIYQDNQLTSISHEEGRIRVFHSSTVNPVVVTGNLISLPGGNMGAYDYYLKDNLGSTRMVITEETYLEPNSCSVEDASNAYEVAMFGNEVNSTKESRGATPWSVNSTPGQLNNYVTKLFNGKKIGPNILLKVMAGDKLTGYADYYYSGTGSNNSPVLPALVNTITALLPGSSQTTTGVKEGAGGVGSLLSTTTGPGTLSNFIGSSGSSSQPKAGITYLFFDENFNFVPYDNVSGLGSKFTPVGSPTTGGTGSYITDLNMIVPKNGYVFAYVGNESDNIPVYFDNFSVIHDRGAILEEAAYYPYGLKIAGLSARAFDKPDTKYKYQGDYAVLDDEMELNWTDFELRSYDVQTGRWVQPDPYNEFASPYTGMGNNPINAVDPDGGAIEFWIKMAVAGTVNVINNWKSKHTGGRMLAYFAAGALGSAVTQGINAEFNIGDGRLNNTIEEAVAFASGGLITGTINGIIQGGDEPENGKSKKSFMQYWAGGVNAIMTGHRLAEEFGKGQEASRLNYRLENGERPAIDNSVDFSKAGYVGIENMLGMYSKENTTNFRQFVGYFASGFAGSVVDQKVKKGALKLPVFSKSKSLNKAVLIATASMDGDFITNSLNYIMKYDGSKDVSKAVFFKDIINLKSGFKSLAKASLFMWGWGYQR